jgi:hypothetical protein
MSVSHRHDGPKIELGDNLAAGLLEALGEMGVEEFRCFVIGIFADLGTPWPVIAKGMRCSIDEAREDLRSVRDLLADPGVEGGLPRPSLRGVRRGGRLVRPR